MFSAQPIVALALITTAVGAAYDWRTGHIPNWLTLGALGAAPPLHFAWALATHPAPEAARAAGIHLIKWLGLAVTGGAGLALMALLVGDPDGAPRRVWDRYVAHLDRRLRSLFVWMPGAVIASAQAGAIFVLLLAHAGLGWSSWYLPVPLVGVLPAMYIERRRRQRVEAIERQMDGFLTVLANALKATPSLGDAFLSTRHLVQRPLSDELALAAKEMRVGSTLDQAILRMAGRIGSRQVDAALSAVLIGRRIGGDLPRSLETTAATLREMARLEGVVRTKTAEGKMQMWVLAVFPVALILALSAVKGDYFDPLMDELTRILHELGIGKTRADALMGLSRRAPAASVAELVGALVQAEQRGNPIAQVLQIQAGVSRTRRTVRAEEVAAKAGVKMVGPLFLLFACIMLLVIGPMVLSLASQPL